MQPRGTYPAIVRENDRTPAPDMQATGALLQRAGAIAPDGKLRKT